MPCLLQGKFYYLQEKGQQQVGEQKGKLMSKALKLPKTECSKQQNTEYLIKIETFIMIQILEFPDIG